MKLPYDRKIMRLIEPLPEVTAHPHNPLGQCLAYDARSTPVMSLVIAVTPRLSMSRGKGILYVTTYLDLERTSNWKWS